MRGAGGKAGDELLLLGQHLLLAAVAGQQLLAADLPLAQVEIVVAAVGGDGPVGHLDDAADHPVHEVAVMAGHQQRPLELAGQPLFQPDDRLDIQMVGRLVEQQHIGVEGQDPGQGDAHLPAAAERLDRPVIGVRADAEAGEDRLGAGFQVVAAAMLELLLGIAVALQQGGHGVVRHRLAHGRFHRA